MFSKFYTKRSDLREEAERDIVQWKCVCKNQLREQEGQGGAFQLISCEEGSEQSQTVEVIALCGNCSKKTESWMIPQSFHSFDIVFWLEWHLLFGANKQ